MALSETITSLGSAIINFVNAKITNAIQKHNADIQEQIEDLQEQIDNSGYMSSSPFSLFDTKISDHRLTGNEAFGWALQGSLVTNTYSDAVSLIKQQYNEATTKTYKETTNLIFPTMTSNSCDFATVSTSSNDTNAWQLINGVTYKQIGSWTSYWFNVAYSSSVFMTEYKIKADSNGSAEYPSSWTLQASNNGESWDIIDTQTSQTFTLGQEKTFPISVTQAYSQYRLVFSAGQGANGELGKLSFTAYRVDMEFNYKQHTNGRLFADISQKTDIDKYYEKYGIAEYYILDNTNNQFYLPRTKYFWQFTDDTSLVNNYNKAGLPNITGGVKVGGIGSQPIALQNATGAFTLTESGRYMTRSENGGNAPSRFELNASLSNEIYGNSETVQPPASNKLLYYCIGSTIINEGDIDVANLINDISSLVNQMSNKCEKDLSNCTKPYINETYVNGQSGYRLWSDGLLEQWGRQSVGSRSTSTIVFLKSFKNNSYLALITSITGTNSTAANSNRGALRDLTTTQMTLQQAEGGYTYSWYTMGY